MNLCMLKMLEGQGVVADVHDCCLVGRVATKGITLRSTERQAQPRSSFSYLCL